MKSASILEAALELLARNGYDAASMDAVAARARVSKPTIYKRYAGKLELALAAIDYLGGQIERAPDGRGRVDPIRRFERNLEKSKTIALLAAVISANERAPRLALQFRDRVLVLQLSHLTAQLEHHMDSHAAAEAAEAVLGRAVIKILGSRSRR